MDTFPKYTYEEQKRVVLLKAWVKLSKVGGNFGKQATETFEEDWKKLQKDFLEERGFKWGMVMINKTMDVMDDYIKADEVDCEEKKDCIGEECDGNCNADD